MQNFCTTQFSIQTIIDILKDPSIPDSAEKINSYINQNPHITCLDTQGYALDAAQAKKLGQALKNTNITSLNISLNKIGSLGAKNLIESLKDTNVINLDIADNEILDTGVCYLSVSLQDTNLISLNLGGNNISFEGAKALVSNLKHTLLVNLDLSSNLINDESSKVIGKLLRDTNIKWLNLELNQMSAQGAKELINDLKHTNVLYLNLGFNKIRSQDLALLKDALLKTNLTSLILTGNEIDVQSAVDLAEAIDSTNLTTLELWNKKIGDAGNNKIASIISKNRERIINDQLTALTLIRQNSINKKTDCNYNMVSDTVFPSKNNPEITEEERLNSVQYAGGILMSGALPEDMLSVIFSYIPSLKLPTRDSSSSTWSAQSLIPRTQILGHLFEIHRQKESDDSMIMDVETNETDPPRFSKSNI